MFLKKISGNNETHGTGGSREGNETAMLPTSTNSLLANKQCPWRMIASPPPMARDCSSKAAEPCHWSKWMCHFDSRWASKCHTVRWACHPITRKRVYHHFFASLVVQPLRIVLCCCNCPTRESISNILMYVASSVVAMFVWQAMVPCASTLCIWWYQQPTPRVFGYSASEIWLSS